MRPLIKYESQQHLRPKNFAVNYERLEFRRRGAHRRLQYTGTAPWPLAPWVRRFGPRRRTRAILLAMLMRTYSRQACVR